MPVNKKLKTDPLQKRLNFSTSDNRAANEQTHESHDTVIEGSSTNDTDSKEVRHFQSRWLTLHPWLDYHDGKNLMFCKICMEHKMTNVFTTGTDNFRTSTISRHVASSDHKRALIAPMEQENLRKSVNKALNKEEKAVIVALKATYWLTKEGIPLSKYGSLIRLLKDLDVPDIEALDVNRHVDYSSYNTATDLLKSISNVINEGVTEKLRQSPCISILTDESTDIATHHKLCISARVVDPLTLQPSTCFLTDVRITDATGKGIYEAISSHLKDRGIPVTKVTGLGTDGASTMTGTKEGLTGVGKTSLVHLICHNEPNYNPGYTIGCSVDVKLHEYKAGTPAERLYFIELWDIGGSTSHQNSRSIFYNSLHGVILVHDLSNRKSHINLRKWLAEVINKENGKESNNGFEYNDFDPEQFAGNQIPILCVGTKVDQAQNLREKSVSRRSAVAEECGADEFNLDCTQVKHISPGSTNAVKLSRFFDKVIERRHHSSQGHITPTMERKRIFKSSHAD